MRRGVDPARKWTECSVTWLVLQLLETLEMWAVQSCGCFITLNTLGYQTKLGLLMRK